MSGPRRARWRIALFTVSALVAALAAVTAAVWAYTHATGVSTASIVGGALVSLDGRTVSVTTALAPCGETDTLIAAEQPARVTLTLEYTYSKHPSCTGMPAFAVYSVRLQAPLRHRRLVDGVSGKPVPFFDTRGILRPGYLPPGYAFRYDAPDASELLTYQFPYLALPRQPGVSCSQLYSASDDDLLVIMQATGGTLGWPAKIRPRAVTVRGHRALAIPGRISWTQDSQMIVVATNNSALPMDALIRVADSVG